MSLTTIGNLMCLPLEEIKPGVPTEAHEYLIYSTAKLLRETQRNWVPLVVQEIGEDEYQVIGNSFIYAVVAEAGLSEVWCVVADREPDTVLSVQALAQEIIPKTNLSIASRDEIKSGLDYLISQPDSLLKGVNLATATNRIDEAPRKYWKDLKPITKLGCRITSSKIKALDKVFYLTPEPLPDIIRDRTLLESFTVKELQTQARKRNISGRSKLKRQELIELLAKAE